MARPILTLEERFMAKVQPDPNTGCWLWTGATVCGGYGYFAGEQTGRRGRMVRAHRTSYKLFLGIIPSGLCVLHKCDVRRCVNPSHLFLGDRKANGLDMAIKNRGKVSQRGLPYGVKITAEGKYAANAKRNGKTIYLGTFNSAGEAGRSAMQFKILKCGSEMNGRPDKSEADRLPVDLGSGSHRVDSPDSLSSAEASIPDPDHRPVADPVRGSDGAAG